MPMSKPKITESDLCRASRRLRTSTAEVETVAEVESAGNAYYSDGFPVILFERHKFHRFTKGKFAKDHPRISNATGGGYSPPKGPESLAVRNERWQRAKFTEAFELDPVAAMKSCSWGKFQLMGFNYEICGFDSVGAFVDAMKESEGRQLDAFVEFVIHSGLGDELRGHDWKGFARGYNGAGYKQNNYDTKLENAYAKFSKRKINCLKDSAVAANKPSDSAPIKEVPLIPAEQPPTSEGQPTETKQTVVQQQGGTTTASETTTPAGDPPEAAPTQVSQNGPLARWLAGGGMASIGLFVWNYIQSNPSAVAIGVICATALIFAIIFRGTITDAVRMTAASDVNKKNVS